MAIINVPDISAGEVTRRITEYFFRMVEAGYTAREIRPIMLFGKTGVGKSTSVYAVGNKLSECLKKKVEVVDIRLTTCSITDLTGIPTPNSDRTRTTWLKPDIFKDDDEEDVYYIYFFDELDKASPAVQGAALQMILDRKAWKHEFPKNTLVIAAANPARGSAGYETRMAPELLNRFRNYSVAADMKSFEEWGAENGVHDWVMGYLRFDRGKLYAESEGHDIAFPTPRAWKSVSDILKAYSGFYNKVSDLHIDLAGEIGEATAGSFEAWCEVMKFLPTMEEIFGGSLLTEDIRKRLKGVDQVYALLSAMTNYVRDNKERISVKELDNGGRYIEKLNPDYVATYYTDIEGIPEIQDKLVKSNAYLKWKQKNK